MLLKNWSNVFKFVSQDDSISWTTVTGDVSSGQQWKYDGNLVGLMRGVFPVSERFNNRYGYSSGGDCFLDVGFGDTPETINDYSLENPNYISNTLTFLNSQIISKGDREIYNMVALFRNDTGSNVTVKEIGYYATMANTSSPSYNALLSRKVLNNPITIAPGESYSFNYIIRLQ